MSRELFGWRNRADAWSVVENRSGPCGFHCRDGIVRWQCIGVAEKQKRKEGRP